MAKGPKQENYEVSPETKALAAIFAREEKDWQQKWSGVHQQRMEDSAQNNYATMLRGRAKKASADALRDIPMNILRNPSLTADYASNAINQLKTLIVMNVLGNSKQFFTPTTLTDTPGFFTDTKLPDANLPENNAAAWLLIGGNNQQMNELVNSQYK